jgi:hypothetical protein
MNTAYRGVVSPAEVDYLQREGLDPRVMIEEGGLTTHLPGQRRLFRVHGISCFFKPEPGQPREESLSTPTESILVGLSSSGAPVTAILRGSGAGVEIYLGTGVSEGDPAGDAERRSQVLGSLLRGSYPALELEPVDLAPLRWPLGGLCLGTPTMIGLDPLDGASLVDRLIRAMSGMNWEAVVVAEPGEAEAMTTLRHRLLNEMREVEAASEAAGAPSPLTEHYTSLLARQLDSLMRGSSIGNWRVAAYLLGDETSYPCLASAWRAVFSGQESLSEPIRVFADERVVSLAARWALPDAPGQEGPSAFRHPYACQSVLDSYQLSSIFQLPRLETPGFRVRVAPAFDVVPPASTAGASVTVGVVLRNLEPIDSSYTVSTKSLTKHAFVAGVTGSGKTNTVMHLLTEAALNGVPFLVIEPAKTEYRVLLEHPEIGANVLVFTVGDETVAPWRLNPFEVPPTISVSEHLDLLKAAFAASFAMWTPLPQVLERCLHEVYADRGWDLRTNQNGRLDEEGTTAASFPTLADLIAKVETVTPTLGYEDRIAGDIKAALVTRLRSFRVGGKGAVLDTVRSLPAEEYLTHPTILELQPIGDDDDKAFLMALILIRLAEYRRGAGEVDDLAHLLVIEEAHRLLANVSLGRSDEVGNPRGKAVETFGNLLSEIRAYGQGVVVADQIPMRLAPDVIKNTNLKIAHRIVAADDRAALASTMAAGEQQAKALTALLVGQAAVFSEGDDTPVLVRVPLVKDIGGVHLPDDVRVRERMEAWRTSGGLEVFFQPSQFCPETCAGAPEACEEARRLIEDSYVQRVVARLALSAAEDTDAIDRMWPDLLATLRSRRQVTCDEKQLLRSFAGHASDWYADRRGAQAAWPYSSTARLAGCLRHALVDKLDSPDRPAASKHARDYQALARQLSERSFPPFPICDQVCDQDPPLCLYRQAVADLVQARTYQPFWRQAEQADKNSGGRQRSWGLCRSAAFELIEFPNPKMDPKTHRNVAAAARRVGLCFAQQMLDADERKLPEMVRAISAEVLAQAEPGAAAASPTTKSLVPERTTASKTTSSS